MSDAVQSNPGTAKPFPPAPKPFAPEDEAPLREALKRCSPSTFEAAVQFRKTGNAEHVPAVVIGVIERFVEPDLRIKLKDADDKLGRKYAALVLEKSARVMPDYGVELADIKVRRVNYVDSNGAAPGDK